MALHIPSYRRGLMVSCPRPRSDFLASYFGGRFHPAFAAAFVPSLEAAACVRLGCWWEIQIDGLHLGHIVEVKIARFRF